MARPRYADVMSTMAVFLALGGTAFAAAKLTGRDISNSSLTGADVRNESIRSPDVSGLRRSDFARGQLPAAPIASTVPGPAGPAGASGRDGASGARGTDGARGPAGPSASVYAELAFIQLENQNPPPVILQKAITVTDASRLALQAGGSVARDGTAQPEGIAECTIRVRPDGAAFSTAAGQTVLINASTTDQIGLAAAGQATVPAGTHLVTLNCADSGSQPGAMRSVWLTAIATADAG